MPPGPARAPPPSHPNACWIDHFRLEDEPPRVLRIETCRFPVVRDGSRVNPAERALGRLPERSRALAEQIVPQLHVLAEHPEHAGPLGDHGGVQRSAGGLDAHQSPS